MKLETVSAVRKAVRVGKFNIQVTLPGRSECTFWLTKTELLRALKGLPGATKCDASLVMEPVMRGRGRTEERGHLAIFRVDH